MISYLLDIVDPKCLFILAINTWAVYASFTTRNIISCIQLGGFQKRVNAYHEWGSHSLQVHPSTAAAALLFTKKWVTTAVMAKRIL